MARVFNALGLEKDSICFGEGGPSWLLADIDEVRSKAIEAALKAIDDADVASDDVRGFLDLVASLVEAIVEQPDGLRDELVKRWDAREIGAIGLRNLVEFVLEWMTGNTSGEVLSPA